MTVTILSQPQAPSMTTLLQLLQLLQGKTHSMCVREYISTFIYALIYIYVYKYMVVIVVIVATPTIIGLTL